MEIKHGITRDKEEIATLMDRIFGAGQVDHRVPGWMSACPSGPCMWYVARDGGESVGLYGLLPITVMAGGYLYRGALCNNVGVVPEYRGKGIFTALGKYALRHFGATVTIGIPNEAAVPGHLKVGWRKVGMLAMLRGELPEIPGMMTGFAIRRDAAEFGDVAPAMRPGFAVHRGLHWSLWRYTKPGQKYACARYKTERAVWKKYEGRTQIMESTSLVMVSSIGGKIDTWAFEDTAQYEFLVNQGFEPTLRRDFMLYGDRVEEGVSSGAYRFEPCDWDVF